MQTNIEIRNKSDCKETQEGEHKLGREQGWGEPGQRAYLPGQLVPEEGRRAQAWEFAHFLQCFIKSVDSYVYQFWRRVVCRDRNSPGGELERVKDPVNLPSDPLSSSSRQLKVIQLLNQTRNDSFPGRTQPAARTHVRKWRGGQFQKETRLPRHSGACVATRQWLPAPVKHVSQGPLISRETPLTQVGKARHEKAGGHHHWEETKWPCFQECWQKS